ncbi:hypothetical protein [Aurantivibrio infirmus]
MNKKLFIFFLAALSTNPAQSQVEPMSPKEEKLLRSLNIFAAPPSDPGIERGCYDFEGHIYKASESIVLEGISISCASIPSSREPSKITHIWLLKRIFEYCKQFETFQECFSKP